MLRSSVAVAAFLLAPILVARAGDVPALPPAPHVVVTGTATAEAKPDYLEVVMAVRVREPDGAEAQAAVDERTAALLTALRALGVRRDDVTAHPVTLDVQHDYSAPGRPIIGYEAERTIELTLEDMSLFDKVIRSATKAGVTQVMRPRVRSRSEKELEQEAQDRAMRAARARAAALARSADLTLGPVHGIATREARAWTGYGAPGMRAYEAGDDEQPITEWLGYQPPPVRVTRAVYVVFLLGPANTARDE